jgi:hypothetical protein
MEDLIFEATKYTPKVVLRSDGTLSFKGRSYSENTFDFFEPIIKWLEEFIQNNNTKITFDIELIYFNSSSSKALYATFNLLNEAKNKIQINWIYDKENETAKEAGESFIEDFKTLNINLIAR